MFWSSLSQHAEQIAAIEGDRRLTYHELSLACDTFSSELPSTRSLVFLLASNSIDSLIAYLACLRAGHLVMMLDPAIKEEKLDALITRFEPNCLVSEGKIQNLRGTGKCIDARAALMLSTSGSTGAAKHVVLSYDNLQHNAESICTYLPIQQDDKTVATLPMHYSYGLSVINTHLQLGSCVVFTRFSFVNREFWQLFEQLGVTSFAAVPHSYEMLKRLKFTEMQLPSLRYFTQAGGRLDSILAEELATFAANNDSEFYMMYGQTEATARMAFLSPDKIRSKPDSIGQAIPGGKFELKDKEGTVISSSNQSGELHYTGGNVMLGYAECAEELLNFTPKEWLATGDMAYFDEQGDFFITGRIKRFVKIHGLRISLDDVEKELLLQAINCYCCGIDNRLIIALKQQENIDIAGRRKALALSLGVHSSVITMLVVEELPVTANGKKDYQAILKMAGVLND